MLAKTKVSMRSSCGEPPPTANPLVLDEAPELLTELVLVKFPKSCALPKVGTVIN